MRSPSDAGLPLAAGAEGEAVRDLQTRLDALGLAVGDGPRGVFDADTEAAIRSFQADRGLPADGICGPVTWAALVEAGYRLGDRYLYHRTPMLRGDDVAELQTHLGVLGFDAGRVDGICGPNTARALEEFQRNSGLTPDGICGPDSVSALHRLAGVHAGPTNVAQARELMVQREAPRQLLDRRIVIGAPGSLDALADRIRQLLTASGAVVAVLHQADGSSLAREANDFGAEVYLGLRLVAEPACRVSFYATEGFESVGGRRLAERCVTELGIVLNGSAEPRGMRLPVLRETRMPAVLCELGPADEVVVQAGAIAGRLAGSIEGWIEHRLD